MKRSKKLLLSLLAVVALTASATVSAHPTGNSSGAQSGMMNQGMMHQGQDSATMSTRQHQGQMGSHHMMMMQKNAMHGGKHGGYGGHHKSGAKKKRVIRVTPIQHLSVDDVSHFFDHRLQRRGNKRLKLGKVAQRDENTITAEIVTVDGSLVQVFEVDRHSGIAKRAD